MNSSFSERFKSARLMKGLSLQGLADALGNKVTRQSLHKYEKGSMLPDSEMLLQLSRALEVHADYFFRETKVELGTIEFRKLMNLPKKEENKIIEQCRDYLARYLELEEILGLGAGFKNPLESFRDVRTYEKVHKAAQELRKAWKLGKDPVYNVAELLEDHHVKVLRIDADLAFDGLQTWVNDNVPVVAFNAGKVHKSDRIRFTLLHELGHLLLGHAFGKISPRQKETLCNQFAGAVLMPEETLQKEIGNFRHKLLIQELGNIKKQYGISIQAIVMRARDCKIVSDNFAKSFFFMLDQMGWRIDEPEQYDYQGLEEATRFDQLIFRALAEDQISFSKAASFKNKKLAEFKKEFSI